MTGPAERAGALPEVPGSKERGAAAAPSISAFGMSARKRDGLPVQSRRCRTQLSCSERTIRNFVWDRDDQVVVKQSSERMANCALAAVHFLAGIFHSFIVLFKTGESSLRAASSVGKWPRALTARRSLAFKASMNPWCK